jgi:hypothetical protein
VSAPLTDESYARAALTYLAEPADRLLNQLLQAHGAAAVLDAIKLGRLLTVSGLAADRRTPAWLRHPPRKPSTTADRRTPAWLRHPPRKPASTAADRRTPPTGPRSWGRAG